MKWTEKDISFLKDNYTNNGKKWCAEKLNRSESSIRAKTSELKLYQDKSSLFFKEWQERARVSKIGKKRPEHSIAMSKHAKNGLFDILTRERSIEDRKEQSERMKKYIIDNGHPRGFLGGTHSEKVKKEQSDRSKAMWENKDSYVNSNEYRQILSDRQSKEMVKRLKSGSGNIYSRCKKGKITIGENTFFARSSWEANIAAYFEFLKNNKDIRDWEHEPKTFWFLEIKRGVRSYMPDFKIYKNDGSYYWVEVKGWMDAKSKTKLKRMNKYYPKEELDLIDAKRYNQIKKQSSIIPNWGLLD
jgi:hypothetical protein